VSRLKHKLFTNPNQSEQPRAVICRSFPLRAYSSYFARTENYVAHWCVPTVTIWELRINTGKLMRASAHEKIIITERGQPVALPKAVDGPDLVGKSFPKRDIRKMPKVEGDSTDYISRDRDGR
jgi:antitoxin (DNA-binding transcriptional repressor) of toxin-antitoxin stability system